MQPVTIKNNQYINTLKLTQVGLCLLALMVAWVAVINSLWLILLLPIMATIFSSNHQTIEQQCNLQFSMRSNGQLMVSDQVPTQSAIENKLWSNKGDDMTVDLMAFWHLPQVLQVKLSLPQINKPVYLTIFRQVIGHKNFSQLLVGLTQMNTTPQKTHD